MSKPVAVVVGVGPGIGAAVGKAMAARGYAVALLSRSGGFTDTLSTTIPGSRAYRCDVTDHASIEAAFRSIATDLGPVDALLYNAGSGKFTGIDDTSLEDLEHAWRINTWGLMACAKECLPHMKARGGAIVVTGATASLRGGLRTTAFAQAKAAQRSLAQSMAKQLGPLGVHVALVIVDGVVDLPRTRAMMPDKPAEFFLAPDDIAKSVVHVVEQPRSAWTFELDLRPHIEKW
ncbi:MAG: SDR family NAD(P)-dependent oxidoreductase [Polyangiaceae bacterium]|nr:SDR family NAD(P)-dependent oxidoreductase [Polyangiaceae bacterium]